MVVVVYGWQCLVCDVLLFSQWLYGNRIHSYGFSGTYVVIITEHTHGWKTISQFDRTENNPLPHLVKKNAWNCRFFNLTSFLFAAFFHSLVCLSVTMRVRACVCTYKPKGERHQTEQKLHKSLCKSTHKFVHLKFSNTQNFPSVGFSLSGNFFVIIIIIIFVSSLCRMCFFFYIGAIYLWENHNFAYEVKEAILHCYLFPLGRVSLVTANFVCVFSLFIYISSSLSTLANFSSFYPWILIFGIFESDSNIIYSGISFSLWIE